ncbi:MAG: LAGLIDADG family homing endonuclease [Nanoarchaeota archaeon]
MPIFIKLKDNERKRLFNALKVKMNKSWRKIYLDFNVSRAMFLHYLSGRFSIPENIFLKIQDIAGVRIKEYERITKTRFVQKEILPPKMDKKLAEILGILNGDGHLSKFKYEVCVVGNSKEKDYFEYLKILFEKKFNTNFTLFIEPNRIKLRVYSKGVSDILVNIYGLPKGKKLGKLKIPKQVFISKGFLISYLKGLFDTDGTFYLRRKKDPVIEISSGDLKFLEEVKNALVYSGFNISKGTNKISIYKKADIEKFFNLIKPANSKHLKKHQNYLNLMPRG